MRNSFNLPRFKYYNLLWVFLGGAILIFVMLHDYEERGNPLEKQAATIAKRLKKKDGRVETFDALGVLRTVVVYKDGMKHGVAEIYNKSGNIQLQLPYVNGKREGLSVKYYENGSVYAETPYANNMLTGVRKTYYRSGKIRSRVSYYMGNIGTDLEEFSTTQKSKSYTRTFAFDKARNVIIIKPMADCSKSQMYKGYLLNHKYFSKSPDIVTALSATSDGRFTITEEQYAKLKSKKGAELICECKTKQGNRLVYTTTP